MYRTSEKVEQREPAPEPYADVRTPPPQLIGPPLPVAPGLADLGERRQLKIAGIHIAGRRRRPSGERAPLPRELSFGGRAWLGAGLGMIVVWLSLFAAPATTTWWTQKDLVVLDWLVELRTDLGITIAKAFNWLSSEGVVRFLRIGTLVALVAVRRWRHFFGVLLAVAVVEISIEALADSIGRIRPTVEILGAWDGPSHPSHPIASLSVTAMAMSLALVPTGKWRGAAMWSAGFLVTSAGIARAYLGIDHPTDVVVSLLFAPAVAFVLFRWFAPNSVFPVTWKLGVKAHLDVSGNRGEAIRKAVQEQVGVRVLAVEPFNLEASGGSTPLRLKVAASGSSGETYLFAKLYSRTHLNSDRWYKLGRSILYGALENEVRFTSVRRLVEYEDYVQRVLVDCGVRTARPIAVVEITPEREYLLVNEFLHDAAELTAVKVTAQIMDDSLRIIRVLWDAGLAHRDIKPSNVMVHKGEVVLIDVSFGMIRPSPWRQAVDLANMMLLLALKSNVQAVYERALLHFAPTDIAEAFAATRSVTIPSQTRAMLAAHKRDTGFDLVEEFQRISPHREPITIQRWSPLRIFRTLVAASIAAIIVAQIYSEIRGVGVL
ncbi:MAG: hypothetical protein HKN91_08065 [Acidimicrobiia bacterium]|nr:hypothetical protein [Acidimicrobiia bacterium]